MNYRSVSDLANLTNKYASKVPHDVDLVVGIPRSGMLVASIISLKLNLPLTDLYSFHRNDELKKGNTRTYKHAHLAHPWDAKKILLVDDSIASGNSMLAAAEMVKSVYQGAVITMAAFAQKENTGNVDLYFETVEQPRLFEWNILHHNLMRHACLDIDGVLYVQPAAADVHDNESCAAFVENATPLFTPSVPVAHLITCRPEKYRAQTEQWLERHGVEYGQLHMLNSAGETGAKDDAITAFKADIYNQDPHAILFIENDEYTAMDIMRLTSKPVFCIQSNQMYAPGMSLPALKTQVMRKSLTFRRKALGKLRRLMSGSHLPTEP
ncbi:MULTISPECIES: phosphoribosyltransferase family protein [Pseudomonas]|uniref:phosphoribosyltransferase family protein n=1 Tax=Pseudomonas TaxID=286 RepID=UPI00123893DB|nr:MULTISPECIES: phosphoribosyltransferase family protein [Pseudomonas]QIB50793.1 phosphoribosyltransferase [Pseudomonas sp. OIL-1]